MCGNLLAFTELNNRVHRLFPKNYQSAPIREMVILICKHGFSQCVCSHCDHVFELKQYYFLLIHTDFRQKRLLIFAIAALTGNANSNLSLSSQRQFGKIPATYMWGMCFHSHVPTSSISAAAEDGPQTAYYKIPFLIQAKGSKSSREIWE